MRFALFVCLLHFLIATLSRSQSQSKPIPSAGSAETVLFSFDNTDGNQPLSSLIFDAAGNLYGTTALGGDFGYGSVFELTPGPGGTWTETVLHSFNNDGSDGYSPKGNLTFDSAGNLYGTTDQGGPNGQYGYGTVFELTPGPGGTWTETLLHSFNNNGKDGINPYAGVIFDAMGNLYGTTLGGGSRSGGTVFKLTPSKKGWVEKVLHSFNGSTGGYPYASLVFDASGSLYGTTYGGGIGKMPYGTVFKLSLGNKGQWTEKVLHKFSGKDGGYPEGTLVLDASGSLYGTTNGGGVTGRTCAYYGCGTAFELTLGNRGKWVETVLHTFNDDGTDGYNPIGGLIFDPGGNLCGTTVGGGDGIAAAGTGTVFQLTPGGNGSWRETVKYSFCSLDNCHDGNGPYTGLILDTAGNLYSTTQSGGPFGNSGYGTVFELTP